MTVDEARERIESLVLLGVAPVHTFALAGGTYRYLPSVHRWHADLLGLTGSHKTRPEQAVRRWINQARLRIKT